MFVMGTTALSQNWDTEMENLGLEEQLCSSNWSPALAVIWDISHLDLFGF